MSLEPSVDRSLAVCAALKHACLQKSCVSVMAANFPELRGTAIGITKSLVGLSAALTAAGYSTAFSPNIVPFLRVIALSFALLWTVCGYTIRIVPQHSSLLAGESVWPYHLRLRRWQRRRFNWLNLGVAGIALVLLLAALEPTLQHLGNSIGLIMLATLVVYATFPGARGLARAVGSESSDLAEAREDGDLDSEQDMLLGTTVSSTPFCPPALELTDGGARLVLSWCLRINQLSLPPRGAPPARFSMLTHNKE